MDARHNIVRVLGEAASFLQVPEGQPTQNITKLVRGELRLAVTSLLRRLQPKAEANPSRDSLRIRPEQGGQSIIVTAVRVETREEDPHYVIAFGEQETETAAPAPPLASFESSESRDRIAELEEDLADAKEHLQTTVEELESANEELQSTNEELIASNEDLQSTNQELHSVNEELHTVNAEHQRKIDEQEILARDMDHLLEFSEVASVFLDEELRVRKYTPAIVSIIPLLPQDVGRPFLHIKHDLLDTDMAEVARHVFSTKEPLVAHTQGTKDRWFRLKAAPYRNMEDEVSGVVIDFVDITAIERARSSIAESEERFRQIAENIREVFWIRDLETSQFLYLSPAFTEVWGVSASEALSDPELWTAAIHTEDREQFAAELEKAKETGELDVSYRVNHPQGLIHWIHDRGFPIRDERGAVVRMAGLAKDVTQQKLDEQLLHDSARTLDELSRQDPLTQLDNRRGLERALDDARERCRRNGTRMVGVLIDCDNFKTVNDTLGHAVGDIVLQQIAAILQRELRPSDTLGRIGGDEFLILLPDTRLAEAGEIAERLRLAIADTPLFVGETSVRITASFGLGLISNETVSIEEVIADTQDALKRGKRDGKNRVATSEGSTNGSEAGGRVLDQLLNKNELKVVAQGIHDLQTQEIVGYEFLSRGPAGNFEKPDNFFRIAAERNLLTRVDLRCLRNCLRAARNGHQGMRHINVYPSTLLDISERGLAELFEDADSEFCLEISEQQFIGDPAYIRDRVSFIKSLGVRIAMDDVGFGRSSLEALILLEPDVVKIDRSFVRGSAGEVVKARSLRRLIGVAQSLHAEVVAEGIEEQGELDLLGAQGVRYGQGFLWGQPQSAD